MKADGVAALIHRGASQTGHHIGVPPVGGGGHNAVSRLVVRAGLNAGGIRVVVGDAVRIQYIGQHPVGGVGGANILRVFLGVIVVGGGGGDLRKVGQAHGILGDGDHVPGGGVVVFVVKAVGVGKVGVGAAQLRGFFVHQLHKRAAACIVAAVKALFPVGGGQLLLGFPRGSRFRILLGFCRGGVSLQASAGIEGVHILGQSQGCVVAGGHHHQIEHLQAGEGLPHAELRHGTARALQLVHHALGNGDLGVFNIGDVLVGDNIAHDFCEGGHGEGLVGVLRIDYRIRIQIEHQIGLAVGPVRIF